MKKFKLFEKKEKKEWEIVSFIEKTIEKNIVEPTEKYPVEVFLAMEDDYDIYSVRRLPDGEIFTLGDLIGIEGTKKPAGKIDRFWVSFDQMRIDIGSLGLVLRDFIKKF